MESIEGRLRALEEARNQLIIKKHTTLDDEERAKIEQRIREVEAEINNEKLRLMSIKSSWR
jgi:low affinity Fe/Cu permease